MQRGTGVLTTCPSNYEYTNLAWCCEDGFKAAGVACLGPWCTEEPARHTRKGSVRVHTSPESEIRTAEVEGRW